MAGVQAAMRNEWPAIVHWACLLPSLSKSALSSRGHVTAAPRHGLEELGDFTLTQTLVM